MADSGHSLVVPDTPVTEEIGLAGEMSDQLPQPGVTPARDAVGRLLGLYGDTVFRLTPCGRL